MCTKEEVKNVVDEAEQKLEAKFTMNLNSLFWKMMRWIGLPLLASIITATITWTTLENRVTSNEERLEEGGRYTQEEHDVYTHAHNTIHEHLNDDIAEVKEDTAIIRKAVTGF